MFRQLALGARTCSRAYVLMAGQAVVAAITTLKGASSSVSLEVYATTQLAVPMEDVADSSTLNYVKIPSNWGNAWYWTAEECT